jgi:hypothetical protein
MGRCAMGRGGGEEMKSTQVRPILTVINHPIERYDIEETDIQTSHSRQWILPGGCLSLGLCAEHENPHIATEPDEGSSRDGLRCLLRT